MGALAQAVEILFEVQRKRSNEKIARRKICFSTDKTRFFLFCFSLDPSYFQISLLSHFLFNLNNLKCYRSATLSSTNHLGTLIATEQHTRNFLGVWKPTLSQLVVWVFELAPD
jgi:hypothetical protein